MPKAEKKKMKRQGIVCEVAMKHPLSFKAASLFIERNSKIKSKISEILDREDFCDCMPLRAYRNSFAKKRRDS
jgi:hypothetical protein